MNIAVLIGVSDYKVAAPLPACVTDVGQMHQLLLATKKYAEICCITSPTEATPLKEALRAFFSRHQGVGPIEEALVYFSGHGVYHNDVLLCCSDFDTNRPASTSVSNSEIDDLLRSVAPDVAVKLIDACQSGSPYIKDATPGFEKALRESSLKSFICMASSRSDQSSYATAECSLFTGKLIDAALSKTNGTVLYRDIQAALADAFVPTPDQTPFFVIQGTGLESFAAVTPEMLTLRTARLTPHVAFRREETLVARIAEEVRHGDSLYVSTGAAAAAIEKAGDMLGRAPLTDPTVAHFYDKRVSRDAKLTTLPRVSAVAEFAQEQGWGKKYFVKVILEPYRVRVPRNPFADLLDSPSEFIGGEGETRESGRYRIETRHKPTSLECTQPLPFEVAQVVFEPKAHPSLKAFVVYIGLVHSLTDLLVLSAVGRLIQTGWTDRAVESAQLQWRYQNRLWKEVVDRPELIWEDALQRAQETVLAYLEGLVPKKDEPKPDDSAEASTPATPSGRESNHR